MRSIPGLLKPELRRSEADLAKDSAALMQAKADLERDQARAENAAVEKRRYERLVEKGVVSREQSDQTRTDADALAAAVRADLATIDSASEAIRADHAAIDQARIQLGYCTIYSPIDGRTGNLMVQPGNIVKANDIAMVVLNQVRPIDADFSVPEQFLPEIRRYMSAGPIKVEVKPQNDISSQGTLTFIDNAVDSSTGTIGLKAIFQNSEERLWPGQFINVLITLSSQPDAVVVPNDAIQSGQDGFYVFVVKPDLTAVARSIKKGRMVGNETVIEEGLKPGEKVVIDGQLQLVSGAKVQLEQ